MEVKVSQFLLQAYACRMFGQDRVGFSRLGKWLQLRLTDIVCKIVTSKLNW